MENIIPVNTYPKFFSFCYSKDKTFRIEILEFRIVLETLYAVKRNREVRIKINVVINRIN